MAELVGSINSLELFIEEFFEMSFLEETYVVGEKQ